MATTAHEEDGYDVTTYNLVTLKDTLEKYHTLKNDDFILRMTQEEAEIYGPRALALLQRAKDTLCKKYGLELKQPTIVEIFAEQKDFGVRTFGMPDNPGFLGVCFGCVITANSPASQMPDPANWEAVLWHEFCHTVTLTLTKNRMPRWLSEGISVYEERQANPAWGQSMNPKFREMTLGEDLTPISKLSGAFLSPKTPSHLSFAYYESSLVVEYIVKRFGLDALRKILGDLGSGVEINIAIAKHTEPMDKLEPAFETFAKARAEGLAPKLDWTKPKPEDLKAGVEAFAKKHPKNIYLLQRRARKALAEKKWEAAKAPCRELIELFPHQADGDSAYLMLARAHRELKELKEERKVLDQFVVLTDDAFDVYMRLMELGAKAKDWKGVRSNAERALAINPLLAVPYRHLAEAAESLKQADAAIGAWQTVLKLDPRDPAEAHYRLARMLHSKNEPGARRHLLMALEEAPRFREAHRMLLKVNGELKEANK
jgi:tetratricopeptide (TPR) repeat protein